MRISDWSSDVCSSDLATHLSLFVGMAPGADMLFLQTAADWLRARNLPFEMTALLPVPVNKLIDDWVLRAQDQQRRITALTRTALADEAEILLQQIGRAACRERVCQYV